MGTARSFKVRKRARNIDPWVKCRWPIVGWTMVERDRVTLSKGEPSLPLKFKWFLFNCSDIFCMSFENESPSFTLVIVT